MKHAIKYALALLLAAGAMHAQAQDLPHFKRVVKELSSRK